MNCRKHILKFLTGVVALCIPFLASALDLPIKKINGEDYYYYEVKPKETVFGLCRKLNLTKAEIVKYNPAVADGLRAGSILYFPTALLDGKAPTSGKQTDIALQLTESDSNTPAPHQISVSSATSHHVKKGDTIYGICKHYGISESDLIALNPSLAGGSLKQGTILLLPDGATNGEAVEASEPDMSRREPISSPTTTEDAVFETDRPYFVDAESTEKEYTDSYETEEADTLRISVLLPFMLSQEKPDRQAQFYTEFYKGFLMAVDSLRNDSMPMVIEAYDTSNDLDTVYAILRRPELKKSDLIVAPDGDQQFGAIARFGNLNKVNVMNIFAVKNTDYQTNPYVLQSNIPHSEMYDSAVDGVLDAFPEHTLVLLSSLDGKSDKQEFVARLKSKAESAGHPVEEISYHGYLKNSDLENLSPDGQYLFVPASGTHSEFSHVISTLKSFKEERDDYNQALLFGYPEWITFPAESIDNMHFMNATIYSRFYNDASSSRSKEFAHSFQKWYGVPMMNAIPVQGILGFDSGFYIVKALNENVRENDDFGYEYNGIQSGFKFSAPSGMSGKVNDLLYFINFRPSGIVDKRIVE